MHFKLQSATHKNANVSKRTHSGVTGLDTVMSCHVMSYLAPHPQQHMCSHKGATHKAPLGKSPLTRKHWGAIQGVVREGR